MCYRNASLVSLHYVLMYWNDRIEKPIVFYNPLCFIQHHLLEWLYNQTTIHDNMWCFHLMHLLPRLGTGTLLLVRWRMFQLLLAFEIIDSALRNHYCLPGYDIWPRIVHSRRFHSMPSRKPIFSPNSCVLQGGTKESEIPVTNKHCSSTCG